MQLRIILRNLMKEKRLTFRSLSKLSGCSESSLKDWSNGISPRDLDAVKRVADTLGVTFEYLIFGAEPGLESASKTQVAAAETKTIYNGWAHISIAIPSMPVSPEPMMKDKADSADGAVL